MIRKCLFLLFIPVIWSCEKSTDDFLLKYYGDAFEDIGYSVSRAENGYMIAGQLTEIRRDVPGYISSSSKKMIVINVDNEGNRISKTILGGRQAAVGTKVISLSDGSTVTTGYVVDSLTLQKDIYIVKLDADGGIVREKIYLSAGNQYANDLVQTSEGFIILGTTDVKRDNATDYMGNAAGKKDILLMRVNNDLEPITTAFSTGYIGNDEGVGIKPAIGGGYIVIGTTDRSDKRIAADQAGTNVFLLKVNSDMSLTEIAIIGGARSEMATDFEVTDDGYLIAGSTGTEGTDQIGYIWKMPQAIFSAPAFERELDLNGSNANVTYSVKALSRYGSTSYVLGGQLGTGLSARNLIFVVDAYGNIVESKIKIIGGTGTQSVNDVISDESGNIIAIGRNSYENNSMITFLKFKF
jgi:hypothetical protein